MNWTHWLGLPLLASAHGGQIDGMIGWVHVFMLILFVGWGGFFIYCLVRFRRSRHPVANYTGVKSHASTYSEIGVAVIEEEHLPSEVLGGAQRAERPGTLRNAEDDAVRRAFEASGGNKTEAARILGVDRKTLYTKLRRLGLDAQA